MTTRKQIQKAIFEKFKLKVDLVKTQGIYYWVDQDDVPYEDSVCIRFQESCTHMIRLNDFTLERWVDDFEDRVHEMLNG